MLSEPEQEEIHRRRVTDTCARIRFCRIECRRYDRYLDKCQGIVQKSATKRSASLLMGVRIVHFFIGLFNLKLQQ